MAQSLKVVTAFGPFAVGQTISDPRQIDAILDAGFGSNVIDASATGASVRPGLTIVVFAPPSVALGAVYDFAADLTSVPNVLYRWLGAVWVPILTDHPSGIAGLSGQVPSSAGVQGDVSSGIAIAGTSPASAGASAGASTADLLVGSGPASAGAAAAPSMNDNVNAVAASSAGVTGTASAADALTGAVPASAAATGAISINGSSSGAVPSSAAAQAAVTAVDSIGGAVPSSAAASGALSGTKTRSYARTFAFGLMGVPRAA